MARSAFERDLQSPPSLPVFRCSEERTSRAVRRDGSTDHRRLAASLPHDDTRRLEGAIQTRLRRDSRRSEKEIENDLLKVVVRDTATPDTSRSPASSTGAWARLQSSRSLRDRTRLDPPVPFEMDCRGRAL